MPEAPKTKAGPFNSNYQNYAQSSEKPGPYPIPVTRLASGHIPELGVPIPEIRLLLLRQPFQPVVPLSCRSQPVLPHTVQDAEDRQGQRTQLPTKVDRVARGVFGCVGRGVGPAVRGQVSRDEPRKWAIRGRIAYVATIPPMVPKVTTQLLDTARTADPPESRHENALILETCL